MQNINLQGGSFKIISPKGRPEGDIFTMAEQYMYIYTYMYIYCYSM